MWYVEREAMCDIVSYYTHPVLYIPFIYTFIAVYAPMYTYVHTRYTCIYTIYTP